MTDTADTNDTNAALVQITKTPKAPKLGLGQRLALEDPEEQLAYVETKLDALRDMATDPATPPELQLAIMNMVSLAAAHKPGTEEVTVNWKVPRVSIAQPTSRSEAKPEAAKNGDLYTTAGQLIDRPFQVIPLYFYEENINFPEGGKNPVCSAPDGKLGSPFGECLKCPHLPFGKQNGGRGDQTQTDCHNNVVCVALTGDLKQVVMLQFGKTSRKTGTALLSLASQQPMIWRQSYLLNTDKKTGDRGLYYVYKVEPTSRDNAAPVQAFAHALYELYQATRNKMLADWYRRPAQAQQVAAEAEGSFPIGPDGLPVDSEPDLSAPPPASARNVTQPM